MTTIPNTKLLQARLPIEVVVRLRVHAARHGVQPAHILAELIDRHLPALPELTAATADSNQ